MKGCLVGILDDIIWGRIARARQRCIVYGDGGLSTIFSHSKRHNNAVNERRTKGTGNTIVNENGKSGDERWKGQQKTDTQRG